MRSRLSRRDRRISLRADGLTASWRRQQASIRKRAASGRQADKVGTPEGFGFNLLPCLACGVFAARLPMASMPLGLRVDAVDLPLRRRSFRERELPHPYIPKTHRMVMLLQEQRSIAVCGVARLTLVDRAALQVEVVLNEDAVEEHRHPCG